MDWVQVAIQWLHVLLGMSWFGSVLYADFILIPVLSGMPLGVQRSFTASLAPRLTRIIPAVAMAAIGLGFLRGTVWGPIRSVDMLSSQYGITWLIGLAAAVATFTWGKRFIEPALERLNEVPESRAFAADGSPSPELGAAIDAVKRASMLELIGFVVIFSAMILMRFGV